MFKINVILSIIVLNSVLNGKNFIRQYNWRHFDNNEYQCTLNIPFIDLQKSRNEFGITDDEKSYEVKGIKFTYRTQKEKRQKEKNFKEKCKKAEEQWKQNFLNKGFYVLNNQIFINYSKLYTLNKLRMVKHVIKFLEIAKENNLDLWKCIELLLSFVQEIEYGYPPDYRNEFYTNGLYTPLEVLTNKKGDCDSKSLLLSTLIGVLNKNKVVLVHGDNHMIIGIEGNPKSGQTFIEVGNRKFILCETSSGQWLPGNIDKSVILGLNKKRYEVIRLY